MLIREKYIYIYNEMVEIHENKNIGDFIVLKIFEDGVLLFDNKNNFSVII